MMQSRDQSDSSNLLKGRFILPLNRMVLFSSVRVRSLPDDVMGDQRKVIAARIGRRGDTSSAPAG
ncbi:MAG: hypothetical protein ABI167_10445 [Nitrosospira sp.]